MFTLTIDSQALARALHNATQFAGTDKTMPALNVVHFGQLTDGELELAATDRYVLGAVRVKAVAEGAFEAFSMPLDMAKALAKVAKAQKFGEITITVDAGNLTATHQAGMLRSFVIDGTFPRYAALIPAKAVAGEDGAARLICFNPKFLAIVGKLQGDSSTALVTLSMPATATTKPMRFDMGANLTGLIMPTRIVT